MAQFESSLLHQRVAVISAVVQQRGGLPECQDPVDALQLGSEWRAINGEPKVGIRGCNITGCPGSVPSSQL